MSAGGFVTLRVDLKHKQGPVASVTAEAIAAAVKRRIECGGAWLMIGDRPGESFYEVESIELHAYGASR